MQTSSPLLRFLVDRFKRICLAAFGLFIFAFGYYLQLLISIGLSPWHALNQGLADTFGITFGQASVIVSVAVVVTDLLMREPIGLGTLMDAFLVGWGTDFFIWLDLIPYQNGFWGSLLILFISIVIICISQVIYMRAGLSCGPRDALMVAIGKRIPRVPISVVSVAMSVVVLSVGFLLGGSIGLGTLLNIFCVGIIMDAVFRVFRFEPREIQQEGIQQTIQNLVRAVEGERRSRAIRKK